MNTTIQQQNRNTAGNSGNAIKTNDRKLCERKENIW